MKKLCLTLTLLAGILVVPYARADAYDEALAQIEHHNPKLKALAAQRDAEIAATRTGQTLPNPEVELGYLWGFKGGPDRKDLAVSQEFDLATLGGARGRVAAGQRQEAEATYVEARRDVLLDARLALIELAAARASLAILERRQEAGGQLVEISQQMVKNGQMTIIDLNKSRLAQAENDNAVRQGKVALRKAIRNIDALNGGIPLDFMTTEMPEQTLPPDFDTWLSQAVEHDASLANLLSAARTQASEVGLAKAEGLPTLTLGYSGEFITDGTLNGAKLGVSLPLWANRGNVKAARARELAARMRVEEAAIQLRSELETLYEEASSLDALEQAYAKAAAAADNTALLARGLQLGEISMHEYVDESVYTFDVEERLLEIRRELAQAVARLNARM